MKKMPNPLFNALNSNTNQLNNLFGNNLQELIQRFQQFQSTFTGDPKQKVQELLTTGQMTQQQFNQIQQVARMFQQILPK